MSGPSGGIQRKATKSNQISPKEKRAEGNTPKMQLLYDREFRDFARLRGATAHGLLSGLYSEPTKEAAHI